MESKKFLNAEEVAAEFGLNADSLKQFVDSGEVRALADRGTWKYRRDELEGLVSAGKIQPPTSDFALDALSDGGQTLSFSDPDDDVSYIELDEEALAEQATMITKSTPAVPPVAEDPVEEDWFLPTDAAEMTASGNQSSSDVAIYTGPNPSDDDVASITDGSDSDVQIAPEYNSPRPEDSGILLDFNLDAGATVSSSGSSLRLPQTAGIVDDFIEPSNVDQESVSAWDEILDSSGDSSVVGIGGEASGVNLDNSGSSVGLGGDSAVNLVDLSGSDVKLPTEESGILLDEGSQLGMSAGSSVVTKGAGSVLGLGAADHDSGITLGSVDADSGISLEPDHDSGISLEGSQIHADPDSGITLSAGDSGLALNADLDSGIALGSLDSGLSLQGADSGLMLSGDSGIAIDGNAKTLADDELSLNLDGDRTQTLDISSEFEDDSAFDINLDEGDATAELLLGDDDDADDSSATVVRKGRPAPGSLSAAFELDDAGEVEDLEISQDLDADLDDEVAELGDEDEVFDASEETFSDEVEATEDDDYLEPVAAKKPAAPKEPAWGMGMAAGLVACSLVLAANSLILWAGVMTMWTGADSEGPAGSLIQSLAELIK